MNFIHELLDVELLENAQMQQLLRKMADAKSIIQRYSSANVPYNDFLMRLAGFSNGIAKPSADKPGEIDVIPVLDELSKKGYVTKNKNGTYKRTDVLGRLIAQAIQSKKTSALDGDVRKDGRLNFTQMDKMGHLAGNGDLGDKLKNAQKTYKAGGLYSATTSEAVLKALKERDPSWKALDDGSKAMVDKLATLSNPQAAFGLLKKLIQLRGKKKGYSDYLDYIQMQDKDQAQAVGELVNAGILNDNGNSLNPKAVREIRNVMNFLDADAIEGIDNTTKLKAFLPNFASSATSSSATTHRDLNHLVAVMKGEKPAATPETTQLLRKAYKAISGGQLTDEALDRILALAPDEAKSASPLTRAIYTIASKFDADTVEQLNAAIEQKHSLRADFKGDENLAAKSAGRYGEFQKNFSI